MAHTSIPAVFREQATALRSRPMVYSKQSGHWRPLTWAQMAERVGHAAAGLCALGLQPGERVAIIAASSVEWVLCDLATASAAVVNVPVPEGSTAETVAHILADAGCSAVIAGDAALVDTVIGVRERVPELRIVVHLHTPAERIVVPGLQVLSLLELERLGIERKLGAEVDARVAAITPDDLLTLIYTSGTTGEPKGVMLTHGNVIANCAACSRALPVRSDDVLLSFLPLSHAFERTAGDYMALLFGGATVYYASSVKRLFRDITEVKPTIMTGVPRVYERIYARFDQARSRASTGRRLLMEAGLRIGQQVARQRQSDRAVGRPLGLAYKVARQQLFDQLTERLGGRVRFFVSGGAALAPEIGEFFLAAGVLILEGYGLTEASPVISVNRPDDVRFGTVGRPLDNVRVRIAEDGEILARGPSVMKGYWNRPDETAAVLRDGWLHTGDIGLLDRAGRLRITDRKKDLFKSSTGLYVAPQRIEGLLRRQRYVDQVCVVGDRRPWVSVVVVPDFEALAEWADQRGLRSLSPAALVGHPDVDALFQETIAALDATLERHELVRGFVLVHEAFTEANGLLTATSKVRRRRVEARYARQIEDVYAQGPRARARRFSRQAR